MSCRHANPIGACALCEEVTNAWDRGFATGEKKANAHIAELTAEVDRLKMSLAHIASMSDYMASDGYVQMYANSAIELPEPGSIARNALRED
jgi:Mn-dependent DtxR family transcriptional regulator